MSERGLWLSLTAHHGPRAADAPEAGYAKRISYVIGEDGRILHAYPKMDPNTHLDQVLGDLTAS